MLSGTTEMFLILLYVFVQKLLSINSILSRITEMFLILLYSFIYIIFAINTNNSNALNTNKYIRQISVNIHHIIFQFSAISTIFCHKFATYNNQFSILFVHYNNQISLILCITLTNFPQSTENTYICGIQFQISPNFCGFGNDL